MRDLETVCPGLGRIEERILIACNKTGGVSTNVSVIEGRQKGFSGPGGVQARKGSCPPQPRFASTFVFLAYPCRLPRRSSNFSQSFPSHHSNNPPSRVSHQVTVASQLWDRAISLIRPTPQPASLNDKILDLVTKYSTTSYTTVTVLLLSLFFLTYRYLMSDRNSFGYWSGGRASPFLSNLADAAPRNLSGHFEYIGPGDELYTSHRPSVAIYDHDHDPDAPDRIHVQHLGRMVPISFPAYSINEETTSVGDLRKKVAYALSTDASKVRLLYKRRELKRNRHPLKKYGMKQNSEVSAVLTERSMDYNRSDSRSDSGSDSGSSGHAVPQPRRPRSQSTVRLRSDEQIPTVPRRSGTHLHPNGHVPSVSMEHRESLRPTPTERVGARDREPSRSRGVSPAPPTNNLPPADPNTPLGRVQALASTFHVQYLPPATRFLISPPSDPEVRQKEFLRLSESIMAQVVLKADSIETECNIDARNVRKNLVNEANKVLKELDTMMKKS